MEGRRYPGDKAGACQGVDQASVTPLPVAYSAASLLFISNFSMTDDVLRSTEPYSVNDWNNNMYRSYQSDGLPRAIAERSKGR